MKVSVIVTSYNHEKFISQAIESVLKQKFDELEIIIGDDCSTDKTPDIVEQYRKENPGKIVILENDKNLGITKNLKRCLNNCTGKYIAICEGDDYWTDPLKLQKQVDFMENNPECSMCFHKVVLYYEESKEFLIQQNQENLSISKNYKTNDLIKEHFTGNFSSCMYRKTAVDQLSDNIFNFYTVDWMFNIAISEYGSIRFIDEKMSVYRIHGGGAWSGLEHESKLISWINSINIYNKFFKYRYSDDFCLLKGRIYSELLLYTKNNKKMLGTVRYLIKIGVNRIEKFTVKKNFKKPFGK